jgi:PKD domain
MRRLVNRFGLSMVPLVVVLAIACEKRPSAPSPVRQLPELPAVLVMPTAPLHVGVAGAITIEMAVPKPIRSVDFGDQTTMEHLGVSPRTTVSHVYQNAGNYVVTVLVTLPTGENASIAASLAVLP